jgi:hypothetical protein
MTNCGPRRGHVLLRDMLCHMFPGTPFLTLNSDLVSPQKT